MISCLSGKWIFHAKLIIIAVQILKEDMMRAVDIIRKKRDGEKLSRDEIRFFIDKFVGGEIPDYQMSAFLMAVFFRSMDFEETTALTDAMMHSGTVLDFSDVPAPKVDKHSTGGVGDKISLPLAPLVASCGVAVPMISGRALGHTGGTLDKLESIPGFRTDLSPDEFHEAISRVGVAIIGQTEDIVPADRRMYALRDVTATVESIPLISSSIMSKKLAEGIDGLVLDVKTGSGAFMRNYDDALKLAQTMVAIGKGMNRKVTALITNMNQPLGRMVGNAVEVLESVEVLQNSGPHDVRELTLALGARMLLIAGVSDTLEDALDLLEKKLSTGEAYEKWVQMVENQGGDPNAIFKPDFIETKYGDVVASDREGILQRFDTLQVGLAASVLGAGREKAEDVVDHKVGIVVLKKVGDRVDKGEPVFEVRGNDKDRMARAIELLKSSFEVGEAQPESQPLIFEVVD